MTVLSLVLRPGSERLGPSPPHQQLCVVLVKTPMVGCGDSLNLGMATGVMVYEIFQ